MNIRLKDLKCSVWKLDSTGNPYVDKVKIEDSPWVEYLRNKNTKPLYDSFYATRKSNEHPDDYWYPVEKFDNLYESIKENGYKNSFCNNPNSEFLKENKDWPGGKGTIKLGYDGSIGDGHHRCAILFLIYGPEKIINVRNGIPSDIEPLEN